MRTSASFYPTYPWLTANQEPPSGYVEMPVLCSAGVAVFSIAVRRDIAADVDDFDDNPTFKAWWFSEFMPGMVALADRMWARMNDAQRTAARGAA